MKIINVCIISMLFVTTSAFGSNWFSTIKNDAITDRPNGFAGISTKKGSLAASLFVSCEKDSPVVVMFSREHMRAITGSSAYIRIDKNPPHEVTVSTENQLVIFAMSRNFDGLQADNYITIDDLISELRAGASVVVRAETASGQLTSAFPLRGFSKHYEKGCSWHSEYR